MTDFIIPNNADPLAVAGTDKSRPGLLDGQFFECAEPGTDEKRLYLVTTDSFTAAFIPVIHKDQDAGEPLPPVSALAIEQALKTKGASTPLVNVADGYKVGRNTYVSALVDEPHMVPQIARALAAVPDIVGAGVHAPMAIDPFLLTKLHRALGGKAGTARRRATPIVLRCTGLSDPIIVNVPSNDMPGSFGLLMPVRLP